MEKLFPLSLYKRRKKVKIICFIIVVFPLTLHAQNLVNNYSFEDTIPCTIYQGPPQLPANYWFRPNDGSSDYFYGSNSGCYFGSPNNVFGFQFPKSGNAYVGLATWEPSPFINRREYIEGILTDTLKQNHMYCVQFYVSAANDCSYFTDDIGAYFSFDSVADYTNGFVLPYTPQVENVQGNILNDTLNWMLVSGSFIAQGGEKYITIGNFRDDANTTLVLLPGASNNFGYYYIDDVSVVDCTVGIEEFDRKMGFNVRPNPGKDFVELSLNLNYQEHGEIQIFDMFGKSVCKFLLSDLNNNVYWYPQNLNGGIYFARVTIAEHNINETKKITIIK